MSKKHCPHLQQYSSLYRTPYRNAVGLDPCRCRLAEHPARIMRMEKEKTMEPLNPPFMKHLALQDVPACREADIIC